MKANFIKQFSQYVYNPDRLEQYYNHISPDLGRLPILIAKSNDNIFLGCEHSGFRVLLLTTDHQEAHEIYERVFNFYKEEIV